MGSDEDLARLPPVSERLRDDFRDDVRDRYGVVRGHYRHEVETALREYLEASKAGGDLHDRLRSIDDRIEAIRDTVDHVVDDMGKRKKGSDVSETTRNRLDKIDQTIRAEAGTSRGHVHEAVVRKAIEDVAGHSDPTIRRYKTMLVDRNYLYPHPTASSRFVQTEQDFVAMTDQLRKAGKIGNDRYWDLVDHIGEDTFRSMLEDIQADDDRKGFQ